MSKSFRLAIFVAILVLVGMQYTESGSSPSRVEGRAKSEPQANFVGAVLDQTLRAPVHKIIGGTAALAPAEGVFVSGISSIHASTDNTISLKLSDIPVGKAIQVGELKFVKVGSDQYLSVSPCMDPQLTTTGASKNFGYTGGQQTYAAYVGCEYKLEVWGAQGGQANATYFGGYGGYAVGNFVSNSNQTLYINVGGVGTTNNTSTANGGYNGGGYTHETRSQTYEGSGGGATHMALVSGVLANLQSYKGTLVNNSYYVSDKILIVAGGGGGGSYYTGGGYSGRGGHAGGYIGSVGTFLTYDTSVLGTGGTQITAGSLTRSDTSCTNTANFGSGAYNNCCMTYGSAGGGGGFYGGGSSHHAGGGGGSGYIASSNLISANGVTKHMKCYGCTTSTASETYTVSVSCANANHDGNCANTGNGYARITRLN